MTPTGLPPAFADGLRAALMEEVRASAAPTKTQGKTRRRWFLGAGCAAIIAIGGGSAYAVKVLYPGSTEVTTISEEGVHEHTGSATLELGPAPTQAKSIAIEFICLSPGQFGLPGGGTMICDAPLSDFTDVGAVFDRYPLSPGRNTLAVTAAPTAAWKLRATFVTARTTNWGVNAKGQTFGAHNDRGDPDLVMVVATNRRSGYALKTQVDRPDDLPPPKTPKEALARQAARPPGGTAIPVYESDGVTVIGQFIVGGDGGGSPGW